MWICVCNAINDKELDRLIADGADTFCKVFKMKGVKPQCGRCRETIKKRIAEYKETQKNKESVS